MASDIVRRFTAAHAKSREWWERSLKVSRGVHHDSRVAQPFPIHIVRAAGSRKWDVDGNEYIDYTMGHGSLMFGHAHPTLVEAVTEQVAKGTHFGCETPLAVEWAELICGMIPAAERVEFTMTGTEADMMAVQLARAYTGRYKILKFAEHFFGWSNDLHAGLVPPYDKPMAGRRPAASAGAVSADTVVIPVNDRAAMERALAQEDIAAMFIEGGGAHFGGIAIPVELIQAAREVTRQHGTLLVIDEVITGFRWSPGGYQATVGVTPDLSSLGKMVSGGLPGAAVCGRADVMEFLAVKPGQDDWNRHRRVPHPGTWNGNPLAAAAGVKMLRMASSGKPQQLAESLARRLASGMNEEIERRRVEACAYNASSCIHVHIGRCQKCNRVACFDADKKPAPGSTAALDIHLTMNGVHLLRGGVGWVSAVHSENDIDQTISAFGRALDGMIEDGAIART